MAIRQIDLDAEVAGDVVEGAARQFREQNLGQLHGAQARPREFLVRLAWEP